MRPTSRRSATSISAGWIRTGWKAEGAKPLAPEFERIEQIKDVRDLQKEIAHLHALGVNALFGFGSEQDSKNSAQMIAVAVQGGLSLPDRDYYTKDDDKSRSGGKLSQDEPRAVSGADASLLLDRIFWGDRASGRR